jgi:hypothetical protein
VVRVSKFLKASASVVFLCLFIMVLILFGVFILHLLRKASGCCMHVFSSPVKIMVVMIILQYRRAEYSVDY